MRILLINPPYKTITSNIGVGHQVPLGLLMVGGAQIDEGYEVRLLDAEARRLSDADIVAETLKPSIFALRRRLSKRDVRDASRVDAIWRIGGLSGRY